MDSSRQSSRQEGDLLQLFVLPLHRAELRYVVAGSVAAMYYSEPRLTIDVDVPILLGKRDLPVFLAPPEYVILWKLVFYKEGKSQKHLRDIARILTLQPQLTHPDFLLEQIQKRGLQEVWAESQPE